MDGPPEKSSTGSKAIDAAFAYFASEEHQAVLRSFEIYRRRVPLPRGGISNPYLRRSLGTYQGKP
jgi:hypothetical protein